MLMIGVSTGQNIANVIPAVQSELNITDYLVIETSLAKELNWFAGAEKVLKNRNIKIGKLDISPNDTHIVEVKQKLKGRLENHTEPIIWNLGGGQKPQQIPAWELFYERNRKGIKDKVCYANQVPASSLELWSFNEARQLQRDDLKIKIDLSAEEIFQIFGFIVNDNHQLVYKRNQTINFDETKDLLHHQEFRQFLFELSKNFSHYQEAQTSYNLSDIKNILSDKQTEIENSISKHLRKRDPKFFNEENQRKDLSIYLRAFLFGGNKRKGKIIDWLENPPETRAIDISRDLQMELELKKPRLKIISDSLREITGYTKSSFYFEKIVSQRVRNLLLGNTENHFIIEAYENLEIARTDDPGRVVAQYDVLCVTNKGTIIALDAKTFDFANKDIDARIFNLQESSGFYRKFSVVLPLDFEDIDAGFIPVEIIELAYKLKKKGLDFFVISNTHKKKSFWIKKTGLKLEKSETKQTDEDWLECRPLHNAII